MCFFMLILTDLLHKYIICCTRASFWRLSKNWPNAIFTKIACFQFLNVFSALIWIPIDFIETLCERVWKILTSVFNSSKFKRHQNNHSNVYFYAHFNWYNVLLHKYALAVQENFFGGFQKIDKITILVKIIFPMVKFL